MFSNVSNKEKLNFYQINYAFRFEEIRPVWMHADRWQAFFKICRAHLKCLYPIWAIELFFSFSFITSSKNIIILYFKGQITCIQVVVCHRLIESLVDDSFNVNRRLWLRILEAFDKLCCWWLVAFLNLIWIISLHLLIGRCRQVSSHHSRLVHRFRCRCPWKILNSVFDFFSQWCLFCKWNENNSCLLHVWVKNSNRSLILGIVAVRGFKL